MQDITNRKRTEEGMKVALAKAEEGDRMLAALMDSVPEGVTICDAKGYFRLVSLVLRANDQERARRILVLGALPNIVYHRSV
jgi:PAS domain-containing protein